MFHIALYEPQIAPNTGNIIRLCANNGCHLHLIEPLGFELEEKKLRRAGLDYHDLSRVSRYANWQAFKQLCEVKKYRIIACSTKGRKNYSEMEYLPGDVLLFGAETHGIPDNIRNSSDIYQCITIPMCPNNRSLNLSNAVAIISYEAWRKNNFITQPEND